MSSANLLKNKKISGPPGVKIFFGDVFVLTYVLEVIMAPGERSI